MQYYGMRDMIDTFSTYTTSSNDNFIHVINKWSHLTFYDCNLNIISPSISHAHYSDLYQFTISAERLLKNSPYHNHIMLIFDIDTICEAAETNPSVIDYKFSHHVDTIVKSYIHEPNLCSSINDETFMILIENYNTIDIAMLVINLTEDITNFNPEFKIKVKFGTCIAEYSDYDITSLYRRAFFAMSTITGKEQQLLANYNELVFQKKVLCK